MLARHITVTIAVSLGLALLALAAPVAWSESPVRRGAYLVNVVGACGRCHSPRDASGTPSKGLELSGGFEFDDGLIGHIVGPNITPDRETGIGKWTDAQIITALRYGTRPDGTIIGPPMPIATYHDMSDDDLVAVAKYLRSIKPVRHPVGRTQFNNAPVPHDLPNAHIEAPPRQDKLAYGAYLAGPVAHCYGCHTVLREDGRSLDRRFYYAGGRELPDYADVTKTVLSRNITSDPDEGIGGWSDDQIKQAITHGIRPDGSRLTETMPSYWYKGIAPADLDAIVAYLRTVKPLKTPPPAPTQ